MIMKCRDKRTVAKFFLSDKIRVLLAWGINKKS